MRSYNTQPGVLPPSRVALGLFPPEDAESFQVTGQVSDVLGGPRLVQRVWPLRGGGRGTCSSLPTRKPDSAGGPRPGDGKADGREAAALFRVGSLSVQTVDISPLITISKGEGRGCGSWLLPFNNFFLSEDSSHNGGGAGRRADPGNSRSARAAGGQWGWPATCWPLPVAGDGHPSGTAGKHRDSAAASNSLESWECTEIQTG